MHPPPGCLECCEAILYLDRRETSLGMGLWIADVVRRSRLSEEAVHACHRYLTEEGFLKKAAFEGRGDFLVRERPELEYFVEHHLRPQEISTTSRIDIIVGDQYKQTISNSTVGAAAVGPSAQATGTVSAMDQGTWLKGLEAAQRALVQDQTVLDELAEGMYEAFSQLLRMVRQIQIDQTSAAEVRTQIKAAIDETWAEDQIRKLRGSTLKDSLEVLKALSGPTKLVGQVLAGT